MPITFESFCIFFQGKEVFIFYSYTDFYDSLEKLNGPLSISEKTETVNYSDEFWDIK